MSTDIGSGLAPCSAEQRKNQYLHYMLATLRPPDLGEEQRTASTSGQSTEQLERTYKKALSDYSAACEKLEAQTALKGKTATTLQSALNEKEDKAKKSNVTLKNYRKTIAQQSSFANNKPLSMNEYGELLSQDLEEELERERRKYIANQVDLERLEQKLRKKSDLAGGVSEIEYQRLEEDINTSEEKSRGCDATLQSMNENEAQLLQRQALLTAAISNLETENREKECQLQEFDAEIEEKRAHISRLEKTSRSLKKEIGYDASDIGAFLQTRMTNEDFSSSQSELEKLKAKFQHLQTL